MNIRFYDPISERWIKPRPEREREIPEAVSLGEALLLATEAAKVRERNEKIWALLKQTAEGCNAVEVTPIVTSEPADYIEPSEPVMIMQDRLFFVQSGGRLFEVSAPVPIEPSPDYEPVESLGYVYWKPKVTI